MNNDKYIALIYKQLKGEINAKEKTLLKKWLRKGKSNQLLKEKIEKDWQLSRNYTANLDIDTKADFKLLRQRVSEEKAKPAPRAKIRKMNANRQWFAWAAAIALMVLAGWWFFTIPNEAEALKVAQTIDNEKIKISLADGTVVWLNENSKLSYPTQFELDKREVELEGEGFFEVARKETAPFTIQTPSAKVIVLGTSFNVNARKVEQGVTVMVESGVVQLQPNNSDEHLQLEAGEKGVFKMSDRSLKFAKANPNASAWKSGVLKYKDTPLQEVVLDLERHFDAKISIEKTIMQECLYTGRFPNATLKGVLENIANNFKMELVPVKDNNFQLKNGVCE